MVGVLDGRPGRQKKQMKSSSDHLKTDNGSIGCSDKIVEFNTLRGVKKVSSRIKPQNFTRADFNLLRERKYPRRACLGSQRCSGVLGDLQRQPSQSTRAVHPPKQEKKLAQQETSLVKQ